MREVIEHFGIGFLEIMGWIGIAGIIATFWDNGGIMKNVIWGYLQSLCG